MSMLRMLAVGAMVCFLCVGARAEEKADNAKLIVGKWEVTKAEGGLPEGAVVEFTKDGKLKITIKNGDQEMTIEGTYKVNGDKFDFALKIGEEEHKDTITIKKVSKTELSTANKDGQVVDMKRKK